MSRSKKKTPITGMACTQSERQDKKEWHGRMRSKVRESLAHCDGEDTPVVRDKDVSDTWDFAKDGKRWFDKLKFPKLTRK